MEIREATIADFDCIKGIKLKAKESERTYNKSLKPVTKAREEYFRYLKDDLANKDCVVFTAIDGDEPVGIVTGRIYNTLPIRILPRKGHISNLFVLPARRHEGIATELIRQSLDWFKKRKIRQVHLGVFAENHGALGMFRKLKFRESIIEMKTDLRP
jgi:ribosomal protein S18 acetylase RimI-like enzyme